MKRLLALALATGIASSSFAAITIDSFNGSQFLLVTGVLSPQSNIAPAPGALGGTRFIFGMNTGNPNGSATTIIVGNGVASVAPGPGVRARAVFLYGFNLDLTDNDLNTNLTAGGNDRFRLDMVGNEYNLHVEIWLRSSTHTGTSTVMAFQGTVPGGFNNTPFVHEIPFSSILINPAALTDVDHIELVFDNLASGDYAITEFSAVVPEPASLAVLSLGALALLRKRRIAA